MEPIFMNNENSKRDEPHKFRLTLVDKRNKYDTAKQQT